MGRWWCGEREPGEGVALHDGAVDLGLATDDIGHVGGLVDQGAGAVEPGGQPLGSLRVVVAEAVQVSGELIRVPGIGGLVDLLDRGGGWGLAAEPGFHERGERGPCLLSGLSGGTAGERHDDSAKRG